MNSQPNTPSPEEQIAAYLALVAKPMGAVPEEQRQNFLREIKTHVETLVDQYRDEGRSEDAAVMEALRMIGEPIKLGRTWAQSWLRANEPGTFLSAFALSVGILAAFQTVNELLGLIIAPSIQALMKNAPNPLAIYLAVFAANSLFNFCMFLIAGAASGWMKPRRALPAMVLAAAFYCAYTAINVCLKTHGHIVTTLMPSNKVISQTEGPGDIAMAGVGEFVLISGLMLLACKVARSWKIRRLTRA